MHSSVVSLPDDPIKLKAQLAQLHDVVEKKEQLIANKEQALTEKTQRIEQLLDYILLLRKRQFGASADRINKDQVSLFVSAHESTPINSRNTQSILSPALNTGERYAQQSRIQSPGQLLAATT